MTDAKQHRVCPWWLGYFLMSPFFRGGQKPDEILAPYVHEGMAVLEPGSGMGFFTIDLARMVGKSGRVIATDIQPKMLDRLKRHAAKAGVLDRVDARLAPTDSMNISDLSRSVDFTLDLPWCMSSRAPPAFSPKSAKRARSARRSCLLSPWDT